MHDKKATNKSRKELFSFDSKTDKFITQNTRNKFRKLSKKNYMYIVSHYINFLLKTY